MTGYKHADAYDTGYLPVDDIHSLYYEQYGNPDGKLALFLHGGPGSGTNPKQAEFFDPTIYRVVLVDQRGSGKSTPWAELRNNTSQDLVADLEKLRTHLKVPNWHLVLGGSWGSTLALLYAQAHPESVGAMVICGIFLLTNAELEWQRPNAPGQGAGMVFPEAHEKFLNFLPEADRKNPNESYYQLLISDDMDTRVRAARTSNEWDLTTISLLPNDSIMKKIDNDRYSIVHALFEAFYFKHGGWIKEGALTEKQNIDRMRHIPTTIIQGRYDMCCPAKFAWDLHKAFPEAEFIWVEGAGHTTTEPGIFKELVQASDKYAKL